MKSYQTCQNNDSEIICHFFPRLSPDLTAKLNKKLQKQQYRANEATLSHLRVNLYISTWNLTKSKHMDNIFEILIHITYNHSLKVLWKCTLFLWGKKNDGKKTLNTASRFLFHWYQILCLHRLTRHFSNFLDSSGQDNPILPECSPRNLICQDSTHSSVTELTC